MTGGATVAIHALRRLFIVHCFDNGLAVVSCKARLAINDERPAMLVRRESDSARAGRI